VSWANRSTPDTNETNKVTRKTKMHTNNCKWVCFVTPKRVSRNTFGNKPLQLLLYSFYRFCYIFVNQIQLNLNVLEFSLNYIVWNSIELNYNSIKLKPNSNLVNWIQIFKFNWILTFELKWNCLFSLHWINFLTLLNEVLKWIGLIISFKINFKSKYNNEQSKCTCEQTINKQLSSTFLI